MRYSPGSARTIPSTPAQKRHCKDSFVRFTDIQAAYFGADTGIASASADSEERFWNDVATLGTPIVNPCETDEDMRDITFLYRVTDPRSAV